MSDLAYVLIVLAVLVVLGTAALLVFRRRRVAQLPGPRPVSRTPSDGAVDVDVDVDVDVEATERPDTQPAETESRESLGSDAVDSAVLLDEPRPSFFDRLGKARSAFTGYVSILVGLGKVDDGTWEELEEALIRADVGVQTSMRLITDVQAAAKTAGVEGGDEILGLLKARMIEEIAAKDRSLVIDEGRTNVWLFVGVNGVGKTTTIGKLGRRLIEEGHRPLMAAGDTFRAAAAEQLTLWAERSGSEIVRGNEGGDPSSVIFDGIQAAAARGCNVVLADTAGRLQNKTNLMDELSKVRRVAAKDPGHVTEVLLVIDATTGQNGLTQAKVFAEAVEVTGVVLTKLDGSAKGGIVFAIESELGIPVKLVGLGEGVGDLVDFDPDEFVNALFV